MRAYVRFRLSTGAEVDLCPGELIGRLRGAALRLDDARVSEAHALVSLRGAELKLLALRGVLALDGRSVSEVVLKPGVVIHLASGLSITVAAVQRPDRLLALSGAGLRESALTGSVYSLRLLPRPMLIPRFVAQAPAHLWSIGDGWRIAADGRSWELLEGGSVTVADKTFQVTAVATATVDAPATVNRGRLHPPMHIVAQYDTVHIHRAGMPITALSGIPARLLSELVSYGQPVEWTTLAEPLWPQVADRAALRNRLDVNISRLRSKLREAGIRPDLVRFDGTGKLELVLEADDRTEDQS